MKSRVRLLNLVVSFTLILLVIGAILVVLGIFNEGLHWDIFGPKLQAVLYGVFGSCMALAGFGAAMTLIIAIQESVKDFKRFVQSRTNQEEKVDATKRQYAGMMLYVVLLMSVLVGICALANHVVLTQRCAVFKRLAGEQIANFEQKMVATLEPFSSPPTHDVPPDLYDVLKSLNNLEFINHTTLYVPDPSEVSALWRFSAQGESYTNAYGFARLYIAKDFERAIRKALDGNSAALAEMNAKHDFVWYALLTGGDKRPKAVVRIEGNSRQSFREYRLGE